MNDPGFACNDAEEYLEQHEAETADWDASRQIGHSKAATTRDRYHQQNLATLRELAEGD